jgi:hypothetical protein
MLSAMHAVEPPPARVELELGRRRHRRITGASGLLLFLCVGLPLVRGCDDARAIYPFELPMFVPPYLYGLAFACAAAATTTRGLRTAIGALRALTVGAFAASGLIFVARPALGAIAAVASTLMLAAIGWSGHAEKRVAAGAILLGAAGTLWFGLCATSGDALSGVYVALAASVGLLGGGLVWLVEASTAPAIALPPAVARERHPGVSSGP